MSKEITVYQPTERVIALERDRLRAAVAKMVGKLGDEVIEEIARAPERAEAIDVRPQEVKAQKKQKQKVKQGNGLDKELEELMLGKFREMLRDIDYRISVLGDLLDRAEGKPSRVVSRDLNINQHILDGYTFTNNSPSGGYVAWSGCHIVYSGTDYTITDGNTNNKFIYWLNSAPTVFTTSNTKPSLSADDVLVAINDSGTARLVMGAGRMLPGGVLLDSAVSANELADNAVTAGKIYDGAVTEDKIGSGAVTENKIGTGAVTETKIGSSAVTAAKIASGAVSAAKTNLKQHLIY